MTATRSLSASLQDLGRTLAARDLVGLSDAELVARFAERRDEAAFTALVRRYGGMVLGVCRRVLRHEQDAEDAFQAAFLVFARNAANVRRAGKVGNWLYGVAFNVARKAKAQRQRREVKEREAAARRRPDTPAGVPDELPNILDAELHALPDKYRAAVVLCDLRGLTIREAAAEAGCPPKTLGTRLSRGRSLLARRLTRRGVSVPAGAVAAALTPGATAANLPRLIGFTVHAAVGRAAGSASAVSPAVAALTEGVSSVMLPKALKYVAVLGCAALALAGWAAGHHAGRPARPAGTVAFAPGSDAPAAPGAAKKARSPGHLEYLHLHLHRFLVSLLAQDITGHLLAHSLIGPGEIEAADDTKDGKDKPALTGTWSRKGGDLKIEFRDKDVLKIIAHDGALTINCGYTLGKDGLVKAKITDFEGKDELKEKVKDKLPAGLEFRFTWKVKGGSATLDDLTGDNTDHLKSHVEGDYDEKK